MENNSIVCPHCGKLYENEFGAFCQCNKINKTENSEIQEAPISPKETEIKTDLTESKHNIIITGENLTKENSLETSNIKSKDKIILSANINEETIFHNNNSQNMAENKLESQSKIITKDMNKENVPQVNPLENISEQELVKIVDLISKLKPEIFSTKKFEETKPQNNFDKSLESESIKEQINPGQINTESNMIDSNSSHSESTSDLFAKKDNYPTDKPEIVFSPKINEETNGQYGKDLSADKIEKELENEESSSFYDKYKTLITTIVNLVLAYVLLMIFKYLIVHFSPSNSMLARLFVSDKNALLRFVPYFNMYLFFWSLIDLSFKGFRLLNINKQINDEQIILLPIKMSNIKSESEIFKFNLFKQNWRKKYIDRIFVNVLSNLNKHKSAQRTHEYFKHLMEIEFSNSINSYTLVKTMIWAMPILGFIGTVLGMGLAIGNFSNFLTGNIDDIALVKTELGKIATGLAYAFDKTLLCLATAFITMIITTIIQKREDLTYNILERLGLKTISNYTLSEQQESETKKPVVVIENQGNQNQDLSLILNQFTESLQSILNQINEPYTRFKEVGSQMNIYIESLTTSSQKVNDNWNKVLEEQAMIIKNIGQISNNMNQSVNNSNELQANFSTKLKEIIENINFSNLNVTLNNINKEINSNAINLSSSNSTHLKTIESLSDLSNQIKYINSTQKTIAELLESLDGGFEVRWVKPKDVT